jgi:LytR cell envelope-related transcriptional attenuator
LSDHSFFERFFGTESKRKRFKQRTLQILSWSFVAIVGLVVVALVWQFVIRTVLTHPVSGEIERTDMLVRKGERIQINILNGSGKMRLAQRFTDYLRARKFDVVDMENYKDTNVARTFIIDRVGDSVSAHKIAYALGVADSLVRREIDTEEYVKADLIIGRDFQALNPMK